jgi:putative tricarboxylic transport membrane protein
MANIMIIASALAVNALYFYGITLIPVFDQSDPVGPRLFPYLICAGILVSALWVGLETRSLSKSKALSFGDFKIESKATLLLIGAVILWMGIYYYMLEVAGFIISTSIFLLVLTFHFNRGKWMANALTSVLFGVAIYLLFTKVLQVSLPEGLLASQVWR